MPCSFCITNSIGGIVSPLRPHSHPGRRCERGRLRRLRNTTTTTSTWLSALLPSVVVGPRRSAHGLLCSGCVYLSCSRSHDRGHLMPSLLSPSPFGAESTHSVGKRLPWSGWSLLPPRKARLTWTRVMYTNISCLCVSFAKLTKMPRVHFAIQASVLSTVPGTFQSAPTLFRVPARRCDLGALISHTRISPVTNRPSPTSSPNR